MLFLTRSALCIGVVVYMLPGSGGPTALRDVATSAGTAAASQARSYCQGSGRCVQIGVGLAETLVGRNPVPASIRDRLPSNFRPLADIRRPKDQSDRRDTETTQRPNRAFHSLE